MLAPQLQPGIAVFMTIPEEIPAKPLQTVESQEETGLPFFDRRGPRIALYTAIGLFAAGLIAFCIVYLAVGRMIDARLKGGAFSDSVNIFTAPRTIEVGEELTAEAMAADLRHSGYTTSRGNLLGWYNLAPGHPSGRMEVFPGRDSFPGSEPAELEFNHGKVTRIVSLQDNTARQRIVTEPRLIATLSQRHEQRQIAHFADIPATLVNAVVSAEDKHFFHHAGYDGLRILKAAYVDLKDGRKEQGASTLTMQLARGFFLDADKRWKRKVEEVFIAFTLERKLTKQQIFEDYANQVYLGRSGPFSVNGFGEGTRVYFDKNLSQLSTSEAALLAGLVQRPSYFNPVRYPDRAKERRDLVLNMMWENRYLTTAQYNAAIQSPVTVKADRSTNMQDEYFVDVMNTELQNKLDDHDGQTRYVYTTLDADLQQAADEAVRLGMQNVDQLLKKGKKSAPIPAGQPQVALIAVDPRTGEIKALVGGRDYASSQLNHVLAMRQPGSVFKPFVYAAALNTAIEAGQQIFTPASVLSDQPTTFSYEGRSYQPGNFRHEFMGEVTLRTALAHSLNVATVSLAQQVGYGRVVAMARRAGLNDGIKATPAVALGAYETTPLEIAGAYTMFANHGMRLTPSAVSMVRAANGAVLYTHQPDAQPVLDPRVNYLMVSLMQEVLRSGTGASVRTRGFTLPAAGKTGTSHDGWFAGFTSELLCVVWVGFDDNRELNLEGAKSALPIWAEFMKRASKMLPYRDVKAFAAPPGVVTAPVCVSAGQTDGSGTPVSAVKTEVFVLGTEPTAACVSALAPTEAAADRVVDPVTSDAIARSTPAAPAPPATAPPSAPLPPTGPAKTTPVTSGGRWQ
jgi:penicillin-binding protein 1B